MMEESRPEEHDAAKIADELEEAAQTNVTQAPPPSVTPVMSSSFSTTPSRPFPTYQSPAGSTLGTPGVRGIQPPSPYMHPGQFVPPSGSVLPPPTTAFMSPMSSVGEGIPPPPTGGFVPTASTPSGVTTKAYFVTSPPREIASTIFTPPVVEGAYPSSTSQVNPTNYSGQMQNYAASSAPYATGSSGYAVDTAGFEVLSSDGSYVSPPPQKSEGLFGWFSGSGLVNKMIEKTKSSVETMITTLDPGMKEVIYSGGNVDIIVTSKKEVKVGAVRQAFQEVFGRATVTGVDSQPAIAPQPVGYTAGLKGAEERIMNLWRQGIVDKRQVVVSVENFIAELLPDKWFDIGCLLLKDSTNNIEIQIFTQATPVPYQFVTAAQQQTPEDYSLRWSGLSVTVGQTIQQQYPYIDHADWHRDFAGVSRRELIYLAAKSLANMYRGQVQF